METQATSWRCIRSEPASGAENMALDEAILDAVGLGHSPPTLRLYAWQPPALSLGYAQAIDEVDLEALSRQGWDLVRRPTGGRAILHADELTYAVIAPDDSRHVSGGVLESYRRLSLGLTAALAHLGVATEVNPNGVDAEARRMNPVCFEVPSAYEITCQGKKVVGSAQVRRRKAVLQHGAIPLWGDISRICTALRFASDEARRSASKRVRARAATVSELLGQEPTWEQAAEAVKAGFASALGMQFSDAQPSDWEIRRAAQLVQECYGQMAWTARV